MERRQSKRIKIVTNSLTLSPCKNELIKKNANIKNTPSGSPKTVHNKTAAKSPNKTSKIAIKKPVPARQNAIRKLQPCDKYIANQCSNGIYCSYMHKEFPCKYYYMGLVCEDEPCKFLHNGPLPAIVLDAFIDYLKRTLPHDPNLCVMNADLKEIVYHEQNKLIREKFDTKNEGKDYKKELVPLEEIVQHLSTEQLKKLREMGVHQDSEITILSAWQLNAIGIEYMAVQKHEIVNVKTEENNENNLNNAEEWPLQVILDVGICEEVVKNEEATKNQQEETFEHENNEIGMPANVDIDKSLSAVGKEDVQTQCNATATVEVEAEDAKSNDNAQAELDEKVSMPASIAVQTVECVSSNEQKLLETDALINDGGDSDDSASVNSLDDYETVAHLPAEVLHEKVLKRKDYLSKLPLSKKDRIKKVKKFVFQLNAIEEAIKKFDVKKTHENNVNENVEKILHNIPMKTNIMTIVHRCENKRRLSIHRSLAKKRNFNSNSKVNTVDETQKNESVNKSAYHSTPQRSCRQRASKISGKNLFKESKTSKGKCVQKSLKQRKSNGNCEKNNKDKVERNKSEHKTNEIGTENIKITDAETEIDFESEEMKVKKLLAAYGIKECFVLIERMIWKPNDLKTKVNNVNMLNKNTSKDKNSKLKSDEATTDQCVRILRSGSKKRGVIKSIIKTTTNTENILVDQRNSEKVEIEHKNFSNEMIRKEIGTKYLENSKSEDVESTMEIKTNDDDVKLNTLWPNLNQTSKIIESITKRGEKKVNRSNSPTNLIKRKKKKVAVKTFKQEKNNKKKILENNSPQDEKNIVPKKVFKTKIKQKRNFQRILSDDDDEDEPLVPPKTTKPPDDSFNHRLHVKKEMKPQKSKHETKKLADEQFKKFFKVQKLKIENEFKNKQILKSENTESKNIDIEFNKFGINNKNLVHNSVNLNDENKLTTEKLPVIPQRLFKIPKRLPPAEIGEEIERKYMKIDTYSKSTQKLQNNEMIGEDSTYNLIEDIMRDSNTLFGNPSEVNEDIVDLKNLESAGELTQDVLNDWDAQFMDLDSPTHNMFIESTLQQNDSAAQEQWPPTSEASLSFINDEPPYTASLIIDRAENYLPWKFIEIEIPANEVNRPRDLETFLTRSQDIDPRLLRYKNLHNELNNQLNNFVKVFQQRENERNRLVILHTLQKSNWFATMPCNAKKTVLGLLLNLMRTLNTFYEQRIRENSNLKFNIQNSKNTFEVSNALKKLNIFITENGEIVPANTFLINKTAANMTTPTLSALGLTTLAPAAAAAATTTTTTEASNLNDKMLVYSLLDENKPMAYTNIPRWPERHCVVSVPRSFYQNDSRAQHSEQFN